MGFSCRQNVFLICNVFEVDLMRENISEAQLPYYAAKFKTKFHLGKKNKFKDQDIPNLSCFKFMITTPPKKKLTHQPVLNVN